MLLGKFAEEWSFWRKPFRLSVAFITAAGLSAGFGYALSERNIEMDQENKQQNRLGLEKSPYLLQHADNPVDWYPWGDEAFEKAKKENKLIFLSIGYSTCHWCHVMEHESFENGVVAGKINEYFIPIKVDREERPDIDNIYMTAVMAMTGRGGWPLTVFLKPDKKPVFGGTYFPPYAKWGAQGLMDIMESVQKAWLTNPDQLTASADSLIEVLKERKNAEPSGQKINDGIFKAGYDMYTRRYDKQFGGFGHAPKFPSSHNLSFLLRYYKRTKEPQALAMVEHTLKEMAKGGCMIS